MTAQKISIEKGKTAVTRAVYRFVNGKNFYLVGAFFLPLVIMWTVFLIKGAYPVTQKSILVLDLNGQYMYFFEAMRDIFQGNGSPFYTWFRQLGGEFSGIYAYYVASPFALLSVFFPENGITEFILWMTLLKVGSCGLTFALYLHHSRPSKPLSIVIFSTCYALTSYAVIYASNTMWIDSLIYLPIICLGVERIVKYGRTHLYCIMLALCFISNFYIGWMTAIFVTLYFFYAYLSKFPAKNFSRFFTAFYKWLVYTLIAAMIASVIIIPTYFSLQMGKSTFTNPSYAFESKFDYFLLLAKMLPNTYDTVRPSGLPNVYCGLICFVLLPVYFVSKNIREREKVMSGVILALMIFSFTATTVDMFWHGLQKPQWLNYRYSYMFCFLVIVFAYEAFRALDAKLYRAVLGCGGVIGLLIVIMQAMPDSYFSVKHSNDKEFIFLDNLMTIWFSMAMLGIVIAVLWLAAHKKKGGTAIILGVVCFELMINSIYCVFRQHEDVTYSTRESYLTFMYRWSGITRSVQESDDSLYRMEKLLQRKVNDNMALRIRGLSNSTSTLNAAVIKLLGKMGYASRSHYSRYSEGNIVNDSLLGVKYVLNNKKGTMASGYTEYLSEIDPTTLHKDVTADDYDESKNMLYAFKNEYALPVMFGVSSDIQKYDIETEYSAPDVLNSMISAMVGHEVKVYEPLVTGENNIKSPDGVAIASSGQHRKWTKGDEKEPTLTMDFTTKKTGEVYIFLPTDYPREVTIRVKKHKDDGSMTTVKSFSYLGTYTQEMCYLGNFKKDTDITIEIVMKDSKGNFYVRKNCSYVYYFNKEVFEEAHKELSESLPEITYFSDTKIKATVNMAKGDTVMYTSIPFDKGWTVKVDGKKIELNEDTGTDSKYKANNKVFGALLAFEVPEGEHTIELSFVPRGFTVGGILAILGIFVVGFGIYKDASVNRKRRRNKLAALRAAVGAGGAAGTPDDPQLTLTDEPQDAAPEGPQDGPAEEQPGPDEDRKQSDTE